MSNYITFEERMEIENFLHKGKSFCAIAKALKKDRSTISREIRKHLITEKSGYGIYGYNACVHKSSCNKTHVCIGECSKQSAKYCKYCNRCNDNCPDFKEQLCVLRTKPPYTCNSCEEKSKCTLEKSIYSAVKAQEMAEKQISESRKGILTNEQELNRLNSFVTPLILQGQSIHQIYCSNTDALMCSEKTLYNYIDNGFFDARNIDLPRKVRYRPRKKKQEFKVDRACYTGRTYTDYQKFILNNQNYHTVQMDSVTGTIGGKVLLTIHFPNTSFMLGFLRDANTSQSVIDVFDYLEQKLGKKLFEKIFPVFLTDRGSEFSNPKMLEYSPNGLRRTNIFYCDPGCPYQKGAIEVNHELLRRILPKGKSFDNLEQSDIDHVMNHINSYRRAKLNNRTPIEAFAFYHGTEALKLLGCKLIEPNSVILKPTLLNR